MLRCAVLCCVAMCCVVFVVMFSFLLCCALLYCVFLCCIVLYCAVLCFAVLCCVVSCCVLLCLCDRCTHITVHSDNSNELYIGAFYQNLLTSLCASHVMVFGFMLQTYIRRFSLTQLVTPVTQTCIIRHVTDFGLIKLCHLQVWNTRIYK